MWNLFVFFCFDAVANEAGAAASVAASVSEPMFEMIVTNLAVIANRLATL